MSLAELVEVNEKLSNPYAVSSDQSGKFLFNVVLSPQFAWSVDEWAWQGSGNLPTWVTFQSYNKIELISSFWSAYDFCNLLVIGVTLGGTNILFYDY